MEYAHRPVLLAEVLQQLNCRRGSTVIDCTLGGAGHAEAILDVIKPDGFLLGIDLDDAAIAAARERVARFSQQTKLVRGSFKELDSILTEAGLHGADGILFDLGVSSFQFDRPDRGFGYRHDGPLDMRMDRTQKLMARDVVNGYSEAELARIIRAYGEERWAARIARFICQARHRKPIETTFELVEVVKDAIPASARRRGGHPARRTFQAVRIEVNRELDSLEEAFRDAVKWLFKGGRLVIISYHSLEDRIAKKVLIELSTGCICPPELPVCECGRTPQVRIHTRRPIRPSREEIEANPRAHSARLRGAEKL